MKKNKKQLMLYAGVLVPLLTLILILTCNRDTIFSQESETSRLGTIAFAPKDTANLSGTAMEEMKVAFKNQTAKAGEPLEVYIENGPEDLSDWTFSWTIDDVTVDDNYTNTYTPTEDDNECFISVIAKSPDGQNYRSGIYMSKLPVVYINTQSIIGDEYVNGDFSLQGNAKYNAENSELFSGDVKIKLRGNSTRYLPKQPYKIKLESKADLLGMGSNKHWVLLANAIDHTFIRNKLVYDFSADLGASYAAESDNVVLILNDEYQGVYQLCEHLRVGNERVDIFDWEELAEDAAKAVAAENEQDDSFIAMMEAALIADFSWLSAPHEFVFGNVLYDISDYVDIPDVTGGFIAEMDFYHIGTNDKNNSLQTNFMQPLYFSIPETAGTNQAFSKYAYNYLQAFEYALHSQDFRYHEDDTHYVADADRHDYHWDKGWQYKTFETDFSAPEYDNLHYSQLFDLDSLVNNFLVCELTVNWDSMKNSMFVTKDVNELAEISPMWDYDWAFGNINMFQIPTYFTDIWQTTDNYFVNEQAYQATQWNRFLIRDPYFLLQVYQKYKEIRPTLLEDMIKDGGTLDSYYEELLEAGQTNDKKWKRTYRDYNGETYEDACDSLKTFITDRITWLDTQFTSFDSFVTSLGYYHPSNDLAVTSVTYNNDKVTIEATTTRAEANSVSFEINGTQFETSAISNKVAKITIDASVLNEKNSNIVQIRVLNSNGDYITNKATDTNMDNVYALSNYKIF